MNIRALSYRAIAIATGIALITTAMFAQTNNQGPFGLHQGMTKEELIQQIGRSAVKEEHGDVLQVTAVPKPHSSFELYSLLFSQDGLTKIVAIGETIQTSGYGNEVSAAFKEMRETLTKIYGVPDRTFDLLRSGSIWKEDQYWMIGLLKKERGLLSFWTGDMPNKITGIGLEAVAMSTSKGYLKLSYEFEGFTAYNEGKKAKEGSVF